MAKDNFLYFYDPATSLYIVYMFLKVLVISNHIPRKESHLIDLSMFHTHCFVV